MADTKAAAPAKPTNDIVAQVVDKVKSGDNILVALSNSPSVDELSAAIGLTLALDKVGKHATAIFSGGIPNTLEFLQPENTFESNTNSLQDFIIALDKEKADHLRYKIEGDFVKVFITPYRTTIDESDLEFSHGDYNVDLVVSLNVASAGDLDGALAEHGRIMHDASAVNISTSEPGKFGDLEWSDPGASSVSEMVEVLVDRLSGKDGGLLDKQVATALLTGIVAATNRFSNEKTTPATMVAASKLMGMGADQQLISSNIPVDLNVQTMTQASEGGDVEVPQPEEAPAAQQDATSLSVQHGEQEIPETMAPVAPPTVATVEEAPQNIAAPTVPEVASPEQELEQIIQAPAVEVAAGPLMNELKQAAEEEELSPLSGVKPDYSAMIDEALKEPLPGEAPSDNPATQAAPTVPTGPEINGVPAINYAQVPEQTPEVAAPLAADNTAYLKTAPEVVVNPTAEATIPAPVEAAAPVATPVEPALPMPAEGVLPPPPPPFDPSAGIAPPAPVETVPVSSAITPDPAAGIPPVQETVAAPATEPVMPAVQPIEPAVLTPEPVHTYLGSNPAMPDQVYPQDPNGGGDPGAFQIPM